MPSVPSLGFILTTLNIDRRSRKYYGPDDTITGTLVLQYQPPAKGPLASTEELFGPIEVDVVLEGQYKVEAAEDMNPNTDNTTWSHAQLQRNLCRKHTPLCHGPIRLKAHTPVVYKFTTQFPSRTEERVPGNGAYGPLPPTFTARLSTATGRGKAQAFYKLLGQVLMPGIDVRVVTRGGPHAIYYEPPGYPVHVDTGTSEYSDYYGCNSKYLLPEDQRPKGFKSLFVKDEDLPKFFFWIQVTSFPKSIVLGQTISFEVGVIPDHENSTAIIIPEITLKKCSIDLGAITEIKAEGFDKDHPIDAGGGLVRTPLRIRTLPIDPFLLNEKGGANTKTVVTAPVMDTETNIYLENVKRSYEINLKLEFLVARQVIGFTQRSVKLNISTPPALEPPEPTPVDIPGDHMAGPSEEPLPAYEESAAPQYEEHQRVEVKEKE